ncbi:ABC transporter ATP-binding protein [Priestia megaterium]|uniref:ABC transporter ATP-binding protein n=1 Tax=Priestia megaterium TaxID=1404 RepID=UPI002079D9E6|nr:ABC transporter ATP-binding protein [Priestia megaterium]USL45830.1 ABC transporter ATP-binding protein [Priestia megaterium]
MSFVLEAQSINKIYGTQDNQFYALKNIHLQVQKGEFLAIMGASGSGKSTLLNVLSGLDKPTSGKVILDNIDITKARDAALTKIRSENIGFIFQFFNLLSILTAEENVLLPLLLSKRNKNGLKEKAKELLNLLGIGHLHSTHPPNMSGGQQQRVAIARALITDPKIILADEPTGSLDSKTSKEILGILRYFCDTLHHSMVMVTHDANVASYAHRIVFMEDGQLVDELKLKDKQRDRKQVITEITNRIEGVLS